MSSSRIWNSGCSSATLRPASGTDSDGVSGACRSCCGRTAASLRLSLAGAMSPAYVCRSLGAWRLAERHAAGTHGKIRLAGLHDRFRRAEHRDRLLGRDGGGTPGPHGLDEAVVFDDQGLSSVESEADRSSFVCAP